MKNIIIGLTLTILLIVLGASVYKAYTSISGSNQNASLDNKESTKQPSKENNKKAKQVVVDVLSTQFSQEFMNTDVRGGYYGVSKGMSRKQIESKFGDAEGRVAAGQSSAEKYGNIAVHYNDKNIAENIFVAPDDISIDDFKAFHGQPDIENQQGILYDKNPNNSFSILVTMQNGVITTIENTDQVLRGNNSKKDGNSI